MQRCKNLQPRKIAARILRFCKIFAALQDDSILVTPCSAAICSRVTDSALFFSCCFVNPHFVALVNKKTKQRLLFSLVPKIFCFQSCTVWKRKFAQFCYFESFFFLWKQNTLTCVSWHLIILLHRLTKIKKKIQTKLDIDETVWKRNFTNHFFESVFACWILRNKKQKKDLLLRLSMNTKGICFQSYIAWKWNLTQFCCFEDFFSTWKKKTL